MIKRYRVKEVFEVVGAHYVYQVQEWTCIKEKFWPWQKNKYDWTNLRAVHTIYMRGYFFFEIQKYPTTVFNSQDEAFEFIDALRTADKAEKENKTWIR